VRVRLDRELNASDPELRDPPTYLPPYIVNHRCHSTFIVEHRRAEHRNHVDKPRCELST
jgi:hypothetical protein